MKIGITRDESKAIEFIKLVRSIGLDAVALDVIRLIPNDEINRLRDMLEEDYDYILFMSANAVDMLEEDIIEKLRGKMIIAVGPKTRDALERYSIDVYLMPERYSSYGIIDLFKKMDVKGKSILIPRSSAANDYLKKELERLGMNVTEVRFYDTKPNYEQSLKDKISDLDCIVFTSASNVHAFFKMVDAIDCQAIAIGPFTRDALKEYGIEPIVADEHTIKGIFKEIKKII
jgi:uroporphyrinogen-III synthase